MRENWYHIAPPGHTINKNIATIAINAFFTIILLLKYRFVEVIIPHLQLHINLSKNVSHRETLFFIYIAIPTAQP